MSDERPYREWLGGTFAPFSEKQRRERFETASGMELEPLHGPWSVEAGLPERLGMPGEYPYTRGVYPSMYRAKGASKGA